MTEPFILSNDEEFIDSMNQIETGGTKAEGIQKMSPENCEEMKEFSVHIYMKYISNLAKMYRSKYYNLENLYEIFCNPHSIYPPVKYGTGQIFLKVESNEAWKKICDLDKIDKHREMKEKDEELQKMNDTMNHFDTMYYILEKFYKWVYLTSLKKEFDGESTSIRKLNNFQNIVDQRTEQMMELQNTVIQLRDTLKNDNQEMYSLRYENSLYANRILELDRQLKQYNFMNAKIVNLEETVTNLEDYVKEHDIDGLMRKLQDRECRIRQLRNELAELKRMSKLREDRAAKDTSIEKSDRIGQQEKDENMKACLVSDSGIWEIEQQEELLMELRKKEQKMKEMEHDISEKDNKIQMYEQQVIEQRNEIFRMTETIAELQNVMENTDDYEKIQELEMKIHFLENLNAEKMNMIEKLAATFVEKEFMQFKFENHVTSSHYRITPEQYYKIIFDEYVHNSHSPIMKDDEEFRLQSEIMAQPVKTMRCLNCQILYFKKCFNIQKLEDLKSDIDNLLQKLDYVWNPNIKCVQKKNPKGLINYISILHQALEFKKNTYGFRREPSKAKTKFVFSWNMIESNKNLSSRQMFVHSPKIVTSSPNKNVNKTKKVILRSLGNHLFLGEEERERRKFLEHTLFKNY